MSNDHDIEYDDTKEDASEALSNLVRKLHASYHVETWVYPRENGVRGFDWKATVNGEDFLDGYWKATRTGTAPTLKKAMIDAAYPSRKNPAGPRRYRDRGEWTDEELANDPHKGH